MATLFNRHLGTVYDLTGRQWTNRTASGALALCCPSCESVAELPIGCSVHRDGVIMPRYTCAGCNWRDFVRLDEYGGGS